MGHVFGNIVSSMKEAMSDLFGGSDIKLTVDQFFQFLIKGWGWVEKGFSVTLMSLRLS